MIYRVLIAASSFVGGAVLASSPFLIRAHLMHADEVARGEQTMGPGFQTLLGLLAAPVGGALALLVTWLWFRRSRDHSESE